VTAPSETVTALLLQWRDGDREAFDRLFPLVYEELRRLAKGYMRRQRAGHTLQTSALINETYLRLIDHKNMRWQNRAHFFAVAAQAMRRILVDHARRRGYAKRGGGAVRVSLNEAATIAAERSEELVALDEALNELDGLDQRKSRIVELRYFGGLNVEETAHVLNISSVTVIRRWRSAKLCLLRAMTSRNQLDA
jgi:RNA polymerase sigma factor (TIGR02999 family)